jgi:hypothetical protein
MSHAKKRAQRYVRNVADREFQSAHDDDLELKCRTDESWKYYVGFKPSERPSPEGGKRLCEGVEGDPDRVVCPILEACKAVAHNLPPGVADGVWGGQVWIDGVIQAD